jgi:hypothetical protein
MCVQSHDGFALNVRQDHSFDTLRGKPTFEQLFAILGLPPVQ